MSEASEKLRDLFSRLVPYKVLNWSSSSSDGDTDRLRTSLADADVVASAYVHDPTRHVLAIDIDHQSWLVKSTTPGHYHLYVEVPDGIPQGYYDSLLNALANAGVVEQGYARASIERGFSCVRLPWVKKEAST
jgi:hypothetical protein